MSGNGAAEADADVAALSRALARRIRAEGPIPISVFHAEAVGNPKHGYYARRPAFGTAGDFVTAPEISQMFGELLGLWTAAMWQALGAPSPFVLAELGPGRGTLMADALRAFKKVPGLLDAARVTFVETSAALRDRQKEAVAESGLRTAAVWVDRVSDLPEGPTILLANEFFDALPIRQFIRTVPSADAGDIAFRERLVGLDPDAPEESPRFRFVRATDGTTARALVPQALRDLAPDEMQPGRIVEVSPAAESLAEEIGRRVADGPGAALIVDYGYDGRQGSKVRPPLGTWQAVRAHGRADPLNDPGAADLSAHADFGALAEAATRAGAKAWGPVEQGRFLLKLGLAQRAEQLAGASPAKQAAIESQFKRLAHPDAMGTLFKALALTPPGIEPPGT